jgi:predicted transcriptional regulator
MAKLTITMNDEVKKTLENAAERIGVSQSSYISQLIMQREIEYQTARFMKGLSAEQIQKGLEDQLKK